MTSEFEQTFLSLVKQGVGHRSALLDVDDWQAIKALADKQGLTAVIVDGIEQLPDAKRPPKELLLQWYLIPVRSRKRAVSSHPSECLSPQYASGLPQSVLKLWIRAALY